MSDPQPISHLFWPEEVPFYSIGYLIGWRTHSMVCVATYVAEMNAKDQDFIVIIYKRPSIKRHHFLSLQPLLRPSSSSSKLSKNSLKSNLTDQISVKIKRFEEVYPEFSLPNRTNRQKEMSQIIDFINRSQEVHDSIHGNPVTRTVQQISLRLIEISSWPMRYRKITRADDIALQDCRAEYVMLFNTLWLIANDIIFGSSSSTFLIENSDSLAILLESFIQKFTVDFIKEALNWTNSYPVGLKLNDQLGQAFCVGSNAAMDFWHRYVLKLLFAALPRMIWLTGYLSLMGSTFALSIAADFVTIATFHLWTIYRVFTFIFGWHLKFLSVLFNIFRGRKFNVLRNRNEPATYNLDQLILGTILFTLAMFLFPTVLAFYILMGSTRLLIVGIHAVIDTGLSVLNHFPLFVVMLRLKDPARLPGDYAFNLSA
ncbi:N-acetylglucosaminyl transferase component-domain-containing protein [Phakopsora pachyrhizi]|uniref:N-acetylglucosaminyl transferase component-domain-containing protein n=1 Tax=Phakopsora pachyrhizi TaxID=170000 RepID=A0AAV0BHF6_PHAPC|nr:N-acetylglucosaminyl transferase component-domain-containing protein [Phakopsora pachyrhizi]CAH7685693.1 N-acetylglucosaminyl transferase component-domain-containing protein [Phakopsora pachyrhizi]